MPSVPAPIALPARWPAACTGGAAMRTTIPILGTLLLLSLQACTTPVAPTAPKTTSQVTLAGKLTEDSPVILLVVADDADTPEASSLRARVAESVHAGLLHIRDERFGACGSPDPAAWHP